MKHYQILAILSLISIIASCAVTSGLQTYNIPDEGTYGTNTGVTVKVVKITQNSLQAIQQEQKNYQPNVTSLFKHSQEIYSLSPGDVLSVQLWGYPEISDTNVDPKLNGYSIDQNGYIQFPLIGRYKAADKTVAQVTNEISQQLSHFLKNPDAIVRVITYQGKRFSVQGSVLHGGQFYLTDQPMSIYSAIGLAGGINEKDGSALIQLIRDGSIYELNTIELEKAGLSLHNLLVQQNDTIYVTPRESQKIYVMGESGKNQALPMRDAGMTLSDVLGESLGLNQTSASAARIYVVRSSTKDSSTSLYHLNLMNLGNFALANQFKMQRNDIVYIDSTGLTRWQRVISQIIPSATALYTIDLLSR